MRWCAVAPILTRRPNPPDIEELDVILSHVLTGTTPQCDVLADAILGIAPA
jgi:hypothetical protein